VERNFTNPKGGLYRCNNKIHKKLDFGEEYKDERKAEKPSVKYRESYQSFCGFTSKSDVRNHSIAGNNALSSC
jgi:hypothetical protein